jgi:hypothetical protein
LLTGLRRNDQVLYATDRGDFGTLNTTTGAFTLMVANVDAAGLAQGAEGAQALDDIDGLTIDPRTGTMWASQRTQMEPMIYLFQIDKSHYRTICCRMHLESGVDYIVIAGSGVYEDFDDMAVSPA